MNMLKPSHKKMQNIGIIKDGKINGQEQIKRNQYDQCIIYTVFMSIAW